MFIFLIILILIIIYIFKNNIISKQYFIKQETSLDILKKRYVKGEITKEEFNEMKKELK